MHRGSDRSDFQLASQVLVASIAGEGVVITKIVDGVEQKETPEEAGVRRENTRTYARAAQIAKYLEMAALLALEEFPDRTKESFARQAAFAFSQIDLQVSERVEQRRRGRL
jgi:hypothetical protein